MSFSGETSKFEKQRKGDLDVDLRTDYLAIYVNDQMFGLPVLQVQDVLANQKVTKVPLAPSEVDGALNLRGRIVTAINVRRKLNLPATENEKKPMSVVVEHNNELYSLVVDAVGDVFPLHDEDFQNTPPTMESSWRSISNGIFRMDDKLLIILDISKLLETIH